MVKINAKSFQKFRKIDILLAKFNRIMICSVYHAPDDYQYYDGRQILSIRNCLLRVGLTTAGHQTQLATIRKLRYDKYTNITGRRFEQAGRQCLGCVIVCSFVIVNWRDSERLRRSEGELYNSLHLIYSKASNKQEYSHPTNQLRFNF